MKYCRKLAAEYRISVTKSAKFSKSEVNPRNYAKLEQKTEYYKKIYCKIS